MRYFLLARDDEALAARVEEGLNRLAADNEIPTNQVAYWLDPVKSFRSVCRDLSGSFRLF